MTTQTPRTSSALDRMLVALLVCCSLAVAYGIWDAVRERTVQPGDRAPAFQVTTNQGTTISNTSFGGELLLLNFWATWCPPCVEEMPSLQQFHDLFKERGVVVMGVNVDEAEQTYQRFLQRSRISFANTFDPTADLGARFGTYRYPETYLINRQGKVVEKFVGAELWTSAEIVERITQHLPQS
jgi:cytochrome c biogenesis protein CcmG, thiol:disulfide interchange protein DsbE